MSIIEQIPSVTYKGNGTQTQFEFPFPILAEENLSVSIFNTIDKTTTELELGTDYDVVVENNEYPAENGYIIYMYKPTGEGLPAGLNLTIDRAVPYEQQSVYPPNTLLNPEQIEDDLDNLEMQIQQLKLKDGRLITIPPGYEGTTEDYLEEFWDAVQNGGEQASNAADRAENAADRAEDAADEAEAWAKEQGLWEMDDNNDLFPIENTPITADDDWELDENGDIMPRGTVESLQYPTHVRVVDVFSKLQGLNLKTGQLVMTQGFYEPADGGGASYVCVDELAEEETADGYGIIALNNGKYLRLRFLDYVRPQWFGAIPLKLQGNLNRGKAVFPTFHEQASDISDKLQLCINFANNQSSYGKPYVKLSRGWWRLDKTITIEDSINSSVASIKGNGMNSTVIDISGNSNSYGIILKNSLSVGTGGNSKKANHGYFLIYGNTSITCIQFYGVVGYNLNYVRFNTCKRAVEFRNPAKGFTEQCNLNHCWFDWFCQRGITYVKDSGGNDSFRGCGLHECHIETYSDVGAFMEIGKACAPYNCELTVHVSAGSTAKGGNPFIFLHDGAWCPNFYGHITVEADSDEFYLCYGYNNTRDVNLFFAGTVQSWGHYVNLGQMFLCRTFFTNSNSNYPAIPDLLPRHYKVRQTSPMHFFGGKLSNGCVFSINVSTTGYEYQGLVVLMNGSSTVNKLVSQIVTDTSKWGEPPISISSDRLQIDLPTGASSVTLCVTVIPIGFDKNFGVIGSTRDDDLRLQKVW